MRAHWGIFAASVCALAHGACSSDVTPGGEAGSAGTAAGAGGKGASGAGGTGTGASGGNATGGSAGKGGTGGKGGSAGKGGTAGTAGKGGAAGKGGTGGSAGQGSGGTSGAGGGPIETGETFGPVHAGSYHNGPVNYTETPYPNACAKYPASVQSRMGSYLAGVDNSLAADGSLCDACALVTTRLGKKVLVHLVTYGISKAPGDMDLSPEAYNAIYEADPQGTSQNPRPMTWQLARCPNTGTIDIQYREGSHAFWTSIWVRNATLPVTKVEVKAERYAVFTEIGRESNGAFSASLGFGTQAFEIRMTARDGQMVSQSFPSFTAGALVASAMQFQ